MMPNPIFDEIDTVPEPLRDDLILEGMVFVTEYKQGGPFFSGSLIARDMVHAARRAKARGLGEKIEGQLTKVSQWRSGRMDDHDNDD